MAKFFGTPDGVHVGQQFIDRRDLSENFIHRPLQAGIHGNRGEGADSIVVSGGYADDDHGDYLIDTGHGGKDATSNKQVADQSAEAPGNAGLITSMVEGLPVRVIRGWDARSPFAPLAGFVYAGLFLVVSTWTEAGTDGFRILQFRLERIPEQASLVTRLLPEPDPAYATTTISRRIRDSVLSRAVKMLYRNECQVCGTAVPGTDGRRYSEGAHVRPLGRPHLGADALNNLLCLCPNHHSELDLGGMVILEDLTLALVSDLKPFAELSFAGSHRLNSENATYQRRLWIAA